MKRYTQTIRSKSSTLYPKPKAITVKSLVSGTNSRVGNQTLQRLLRSNFLQAKLTIGHPNDVYEQEADRVADQVMRMPNSDMEATEASSIAQDSLPEIQRLCPECENEVQRQPLEEEEEELVQAKSESQQVPDVDASTERAITNLQGSGRPLTESARSFMEPRFGHDFGGVRIHTDSHAANVARSINAKAFTVGQDIVFGSGEYTPESSSGRHLIAHELTHVVQQNGK